MKEEKIKICRKHQDYKVPLISTFAFNSVEYWCPYCGEARGMLGAGEDVWITEELKARKKYYEICSRLYLHACAMRTCISTEFYGEEIKPKELPKREWDLLHLIIDNYKFNVKAEEDKIGL